MSQSARQRVPIGLVRTFVVAGVLLSPMAASAQPIRILTHSLTGDTVRVGVGAPPTVLAVFATWCRTCQDEVPALNMLQREFGAHGVRVVGLSMDEGSTERIEKWLKQQSATYAVARDSTGAVAQSLGVVGVPEVYLINSSGHVQWMRRGPFMSGLPELRALLKQLPAPHP